METVLQTALTLQGAGTAFALATVVRCEKPTSARLGDRAIVYADGQLEGWIGGSCAQPVVVREALRALSEGQPRLIGLAGEGAQITRPGLIAYPMSCHSGGTLEIYIEPFLPQARLVVVGQTPIARALARLASACEFQVSTVVADALDPALLDARSYVVVATQGGDEPALLAALQSPAAYVGLIASRRRAASLLAFLRAEQLDETRLARLKAPAGLDIGAATPEEVAVSLLAELIQLRRRGTVAATVLPATPLALTLEAPALAIDPVCGMEIAVSAAQHSAEIDGRTYYFCCPGCRGRFVKNPQRFLTASASTPLPA